VLLETALGTRHSFAIVVVTQRFTSVRWLCITLSVLVFVAAAIGISAAFSYTGPIHHVPGSKQFTMDHVFNGTFNAVKKGLAWVPEGA
jgi:hypothetical protein